MISKSRKNYVLRKKTRELSHPPPLDKNKMPGFNLIEEFRIDILLVNFGMITFSMIKGIN
jgi:hypothetical protein